MRKEFIAICDCLCFNHIIGFFYYPIKFPIRWDMTRDANPICIILKAQNIFTEIIPPFNLYGWEYYFNYNYFKRIKLVLKYLLNKQNEIKISILDWFSLSKEDGFRLYDFLNDCDKFESVENNDSKNDLLELEDEYGFYKITFYKDKDENIKNSEYSLAYKFSFCDGDFWKRLKISFSYLFSCKKNEEKIFQITKESQIETLKKIIDDIQKENFKISDIPLSITDEIIKEMNNE